MNDNHSAERTSAGKIIGTALVGVLTIPNKIGQAGRCFKEGYQSVRPASETPLCNRAGQKTAKKVDWLAALPGKVGKGIQAFAGDVMEGVRHENERHVAVIDSKCKDRVIENLEDNLRSMTPPPVLPSRDLRPGEPGYVDVNQTPAS
jgi:hypothetical protein